MFWNHHTRPLETIARTGFLVSLVSYLAFWLTDLLQPGFVSRYFSVHIFLLVAVIFGVLWSYFMEEYTERIWIHGLVMLAFGVFLSVLTWSLTKDLDVYRVLLVMLSFVSPFILYRLLRS